jgi:hypothetical protein
MDVCPLLSNAYYQADHSSTGVVPSVVFPLCVIVKT